MKNFFQQYAMKDFFDSGSNGGGVTSWNDLTDKPFYTEVLEDAEILPETTATAAEFVEQGIPTSAEFVAGETYRLTINGASSETTAFEFSQDGITVVCIGNKGLMDGTYDGSGEPYIGFVLGGTFRLMSVEFADQDSITVMCTGHSTIHHKLPKEYAPENTSTIIAYSYNEETNEEQRKVIPVLDVPECEYVFGRAQKEVKINTNGQLCYDSDIKANISLHSSTGTAFPGNDKNEFAVACGNVNLSSSTGMISCAVHWTNHTISGLLTIVYWSPVTPNVVKAYGICADYHDFTMYKVTLDKPAEGSGVITFRKLDL